nr:hypothetical protein BaRGS_002871 [Batillaria attramentaria]
MTDGPPVSVLTLNVPVQPRLTVTLGQNGTTEYLRHSGDPKNIDDITKDLHRQFPNHEMFLSKGGHG